MTLDQAAAFLVFALLLPIVGWILFKENRSVKASDAQQKTDKDKVFRSLKSAYKELDQRTEMYRTVFAAQPWVLTALWIGQALIGGYFIAKGTSAVLAVINGIVCVLAIVETFAANRQAKSSQPFNMGQSTYKGKKAAGNRVKEVEFDGSGRKDISFNENEAFYLAQTDKMTGRWKWWTSFGLSWVVQALLGWSFTIACKLPMVNHRIRSGLILATQIGVGLWVLTGLSLFIFSKESVLWSSHETQLSQPVLWGLMIIAIGVKLFRIHLDQFEEYKKVRVHLLAAESNLPIEIKTHAKYLSNAARWKDALKPYQWKILILATLTVVWVSGAQLMVCGLALWSIKNHVSTRRHLNIKIKEMRRLGQNAMQEQFKEKVGFMHHLFPTLQMSTVQLAKEGHNDEHFYEVRQWPQGGSYLMKLEKHSQKAKDIENRFFKYSDIAGDQPVTWITNDRIDFNKWDQRCEATPSETITVKPQLSIF